jgi:tagaturonate epimerase
VSVRGLETIERSKVRIGELQVALGWRDHGELALVVRGDEAGEFEGERDSVDGEDVVVGPTSAGNATALRARAPWLVPRPLGVQGSVGLGDRLGLATPGHVRALRATGEPLAPIFAQQSVRELDRIGRTPGQVLDDATWGVVSEGWQEPFGADADHVKTPQDIDRFVDSGYTQFTLDPGDHVRDEAETASAPELEALLEALPWERLRDTSADMRGRYEGRSVELADSVLTLSGEDVSRAAAKYGAAIVQVASLAEHLAGRRAPSSYEIEVSLDEVQTPTSAAQHAFVALELARLGVPRVGLAPRFVGEMQKGIDYVGDLDLFAREFAVHAQIADALGPYKLSIHSGSDKFSIYPIIASLAPGAVHLKTSGTSYLEALRVLSSADLDLFRRIYALALKRFAADRRSYHLSVDADALPAPASLRDDQLPVLLDDNASRQVLHVTFGSVLGGELGLELRERITELHEQYAAALERHLGNHLRPFA